MRTIPGVLLMCGNDHVPDGWIEVQSDDESPRFSSDTGAAAALARVRGTDAALFAPDIGVAVYLVRSPHEDSVIRALDAYMDNDPGLRGVCPRWVTMVREL